MQSWIDELRFSLPILRWCNHRMMEEANLRDKHRPWVVRNLLRERMMKLKHEGGNHLLPKFVIEPKVFD